MRIGINYPWFNYGWDFGPAPNGWGPRAAWRNEIDADLAAFAHSGIELLRWFILADGSSYGYGSAAPQRAGRRWRWEAVPQADACMLDDFEELLERCSRVRLRLLPVLIDFHWGFPGFDLDTTDPLTLRCWHSSRAAAAKLPRGMVKGGRSDVFIDPAARSDFYAHVLEPFLARSERHRDTLYAWELINEPEWITRTAGTWFSPTRRIPLDDMLTFLHEGARVIHGYGFRPSVGFASQRSASAWNERAAALTQPLAREASAEPARGLGLGLDQIHYYAQLGRGPLPELRAHDPPVVLGEFGTRMPGAPARTGLICNDLATDRWPELGDQSVTARLLRARALGYESALAWAYRSHDCRTAADRQALLRAIAALHQPAV